MSSYPSEEGIVEYFEGLVEYMRKLGYEDPRDKRIAKLEADLSKFITQDNAKLIRIRELEALISSGFQQLSGRDVADALIENAELKARLDAVKKVLEESRHCEAPQAMTLWSDVLRALGDDDVN